MIVSNTVRGKMNKWDLIKEFVKGKIVLDIGAVGNQLTENNIGYKIKDATKLYYGIDTQESDKPDIAKMNAETFNLNFEYEVIIALDIIEHLSNPGLFLDRCKEHLKKEGVLLITTPNDLALTYQLEGRFFLNPEHVNTYQGKTLEGLLERHGFKADIIHYHNTDGIAGKIISWFLFGSMKRSLFAVARKK